MTSLFAQPPKPASTGLFGSSVTAAPQKSLFGASSTQPAPSGGLFGSTQTSQPAQSSSLFGAPNAQPAAGASLFGATQPQAQSTGLFGQQPQQSAQSTSLFGAKPQTSSLFGAQAQPQQVGQSTSLFGSSQAQQPQQTQQQQQNNFSGTLGQNLSDSIGPVNAQIQREQVQQRLQGAGLNSSIREKTVPQQIETLTSKWGVINQQDTILQTYLYNAANPAFAPFYHPAPGELEQDYEAALAKKPEPVDGNTWVPVLIRGFKALGERVEYQAKFVQNMQVRLHEMNNALSAIMAKHSQHLSARIEASKRQHAAISARTLRLAVKCQVLRNRGYALDGQEDKLRATLLELEKKAQDPEYASREEEIWARMVILRERAKWLEEEGKRLGKSVNGQPADGDRISGDVLDSARRILRDYDIQIQQLSKEVNEVQKDFSEWSQR